MAAARVIVVELRIYPDLLAITRICSSRTISNAARWGLGSFPFGEYLMTSHGLDAVRCRKFGRHVEKMIMEEASLLNESSVQ